MNIGILVHSKTGTTLKFGRMMGDQLKEHGHQVEIVELKTDIPVNSGPAQPGPAFTIVNSPDCKKYDALLVGGPVWGFAASPVIRACIKGLKDISGKKALPFVTMGFPLPGMGGKRAIKQMNDALRAAGAVVLPGTIIPKLFRDQAGLMAAAARAIPGYFAANTVV